MNSSSNICWFEQEVSNILLQSDNNTGTIGSIKFDNCLFQPNATVTTFFGIDGTYSGSLCFDNCQMWTTPNSNANFPSYPIMSISGTYKLNNCYLYNGTVKTNVNNQTTTPNAGGTSSIVSYPLLGLYNGLWSDGSTEVCISAGGSDCFRIGNSRTFTVFPIWHGDGSSSAPSITFTNNQNSGLYNTSGTVNVSSLGVNVASFNNTGINMNSYSIQNASNLRSASFVPTYTNIINVSSITNVKAYYTVCNDVITVYVKCLVQCTSANTVSQFSINYPITNASGTCVGSGITSNLNGNVSWMIDNNTGSLSCVVSTTASSTANITTGVQNVYLSFMYQ